MITKIVKYLSILTMILGYLFLVLNISKYGIKSNFTDLFNTAWVFGIASVVLNSVYVILSDLNDDFLWWIGFVGLIWFVPFFVELDTFYGIPSLIIYFLLIIYIHRDFLNKKIV